MTGLALRLPAWLSFAVGTYFMLVPQTHAGELLVHGVSRHFHDNGENNLNFGVGYGFDSRVVMGAYHNSRRRLSAYAGYHIPVYEWRSVEFGLFLGAVTGYDRTVMPVAALTASIPIADRWRTHVTVVPSDRGVATLSLGYRF
jgi:hypothetical protein